MSVSKPCHREGCQGIVRRADMRFCSRKCSRQPAQKVYRVTNAERMPSPPASSWWLDTATFYDEARKRFPPDDPKKTCEPVQTYGEYRPSLIGMGRERLKDRAERER